MAIILKEQGVLEYSTGDTLPVVDVIVGTKARNTNTGDKKTWDGSSWIEGWGTITVVDDLTTGGTTDALSAEQGKVIGGRINGSTVHLGLLAGEIAQGDNTVAIGIYAGRDNQLYNSIAIGATAGRTNQATYGIAIGSASGETDQQKGAIAIGSTAGYIDQGQDAIALGTNAARINQGARAIAIGRYAVTNDQEAGGVVIYNETAEFTYIPSTKIWNLTNDTVDAILHINGVPLAAGPQGETGVGYVIKGSTDHNTYTGMTHSAGDIWIMTDYKAAQPPGAGTVPGHEIGDGIWTNADYGPGLVFTNVGRLAGEAATATAGVTTEGAALVTNVGTTSAAIFDFRVPKGIPGVAAGFGDPIIITGAPGSLASIKASGLDTEKVFEFTIPRGDKGEPGSDSSVPGEKGDKPDHRWVNTTRLQFELPNGVWGAEVELKGQPGLAASISSATATSIEHTEEATVTLDGSPSNREFTFGIPKGIPGTNGTSSTVGVFNPTITGNAGTNALVTNEGDATDALFQFTIPRGDKGEPGVDGSGVTIQGSDTIININDKAGVAGDMWISTTAGTDDLGSVVAAGDGIVYDGVNWNSVGPIRGPQGDTGLTGDNGDSAAISGADASVVDWDETPTVGLGGTNLNRTFSFGIPAGKPGTNGSAANITGATATGLPAGDDPTVGLGGTSQSRTFSFGIPAGAKGDKGDAPVKNVDYFDGITPTVGIHSTITGNAGTQALVQDMEGGANLNLKFTIPRGNTGASGSAGTVVTVGTTSTGAVGSDASVSDGDPGAGVKLDFTIPRGDKGEVGPAGPTAVSTDTNNTATIGTDAKIYVPNSASTDDFNDVTTRGNFSNRPIRVNNDPNGLEYMDISSTELSGMNLFSQGFNLIQSDSYGPGKLPGVGINGSADGTSAVTINGTTRFTDGIGGTTAYFSDTVLLDNASTLEMMGGANIKIHPDPDPWFIDAMISLDTELEIGLIHNGATPSIKLKSGTQSLQVNHDAGSGGVSINGNASTTGSALWVNGKGMFTNTVTVDRGGNASNKGLIVKGTVGMAQTPINTTIDTKGVTIIGESNDTYLTDSLLTMYDYGEITRLNGSSLQFDSTDGASDPMILTEAELRFRGETIFNWDQNGRVGVNSPPSFSNTLAVGGSALVTGDLTVNNTGTFKDINSTHSIQIGNSAGVHTAIFENDYMFNGTNSSFKQRIIGGFIRFQFRTGTSTELATLEMSKDRTKFLIGIEGSTGTFTGNLYALNFNLNSDVKLKDNIKPLESKSLNPVSFNWKDSGKADIGFIAQEVEELYPQVVSTDKEGIKSLSYSKITAINAARINELEERIERLELLIQTLL